MKAWICICAVVLAAGPMTVLAQETGTGAQASATAGAAASTNGVAVPPPGQATSTSATAVAKESKPPVAAPPATTATPPKVTSSPRSAASAAALSTESSGTGHKAALTNLPPVPATPKPASVTDNEEPPAVEPSLPTNTVPAPPEIAASTTDASSGAGHISLWVLGVVLLVVVGGGLAVFLVQRGGSNSHGSLITSAMNEIKKTEKAEEKHDDKPEDSQPGDKKEGKVEVKKFPPSMN